MLRRLLVLALLHLFRSFLEVRLYWLEESLKKKLTVIKYMHILRAL